MHILQVKNLYKSYGKTEVIKNVSFSIEDGKIYGLLGPNGAGKSTIIKIITGIEKQDSGEIVFDEKITNINKYKKNIGLITQDIAIYPNFTVYENVYFFCSLYSYRGKELRKRVEKALEFVGLNDYKDKKAGELSGGMMRRLHISCSIAHSPKLIIMDEPTVGIDSKSRNYILKSVKQLKDEGASIIYTSHYIEEMEEICDEICILNKGEIIVKGNTKDLKSNSLSSVNYTIILKNNIENIDSAISKIEGIDLISINNKELKCCCSKEVNILPKLINTIYNHGGIIESIQNKLPTLETIFLNLTGDKLHN